VVVIGTSSSSLLPIAFCVLYSFSGVLDSFDMMAARLYKHYVNLSNIIIRLSDGTDQGKIHAVLINSHLDSTLPSPGAADDALSVGVMIECVRVLVNTPGWEPKHAVIFCEFYLISMPYR